MRDKNILARSSEYHESSAAWNHISMQYFSQRYFTTTGGRYFVFGCTLLARRNSRSVFNHRRKVSTLTPAARANSDLVYDFMFCFFSNL